MVGFVISLGGSSIFNNNNKYNDLFLKSLLFLKKHKNVILVVGGGIKARQKIASCKSNNNFDKDMIAINVTKQNAKYVASKLGFKFYDINCAEDIIKLPQGQVVVGGMLPGLTTDAVATLIAEQKEYNFINTTNVDGVYTKDPRKHKDAKLLKMVEINELIKIVLKSDKRAPGTNTVLDLISLFIVRRSQIPTIVCKATHKNIKSAIARKAVGTKVQFN